MMGKIYKMKLGVVSILGMMVFLCSFPILAQEIDPDLRPAIETQPRYKNVGIAIPPYLNSQLEMVTVNGPIRLRRFVKSQLLLRRGISYMNIKLNRQLATVQHTNVMPSREVTRDPIWVESMTKWLRDVFKEQDVSSLFFVSGGTHNFVFLGQLGKALFYEIPRQFNPPVFLHMLMKFAPEENPKYFMAIFAPGSCVLSVYSFVTEAEERLDENALQSAVKQTRDLDICKLVLANTSILEEERAKVVEFLHSVNRLNQKVNQEREGYEFTIEFGSLKNLGVKGWAVFDWYVGNIKLHIETRMSSYDFQRSFQLKETDEQNRFYPTGDYRQGGHEHEGNVDTGTGFRFGFQK